MTKGIITRVGEAIDQYISEQRPIQRVEQSDRAFLSGRGRIIRWFLPNGGTILLVGLLLWAQSAGAIPLPAVRSVPDASSTNTISYQGRLADTSGTPVTALVNMEFRIYNAASGGGPLWEEFWTGANAVSVSDGLFNVMLGSLVPIPQSIVAGNSSLWLGITAGTDNEMTPRVQLGSVPFATQALTVPDGSVTTAKIANAAVTAAKLDSTPWADLSLASGFVSPGATSFQKAQYRRVGDIVYLRGIVIRSSGNILDQENVAYLASGFRPLAIISFNPQSRAEDRRGHMLDIGPGGNINVNKTAGTNIVILDGIQFGLN